MKDAEKKLLEALSKHLGVEDVPPVVYVSDEEKQLKEQRLLDRWSKLLEPKSEPEVIEEKTFVDAALDNAKTVTQPVFSPVEPQPQLPEKDFVTKSVEALSKTTKKKDDSTGIGNDPTARDIAMLKKSVTDLHHFASRISQMGGGGEVNLRYLDDVDRSTITDGYYLRYDATSKKFIFDKSAFISTYYAGANIAMANTANVYIVPSGVSADGIRHFTFGSNNDYVVGETGNYVVDYSIQYINTGNESADIYIWLRKNEADVPNSASVFTIPARKTSNDPGKLIAITPLFLGANTGDRIQVVTSAPYSNNISIVTIPATTANSTVPTIPQVPATIVMINQVV